MFELENVCSQISALTSLRRRLVAKGRFESRLILVQKVWFDMLSVFTVIFLDSLGVMIRLQFSCDFFAPILSL